MATRRTFVNRFWKQANPLTSLRQWLLLCLLVPLLCLIFLHPTPLLAQTELVTQTIHYQVPEAGEVFLVWGVDGWGVIPEDMRPEKTVIKNGVMYTLMDRDNDTFVAQISVPFETVVDYSFLITKKRQGLEINPVWDNQLAYQIVAEEDDTIEIETAVTLAEAEIVFDLAEHPLVTQEIRYHLPEAGEVFLVWGVEGWHATPPEIRPVGTVLKKRIMNTPMVPEDGTFTLKLQVPAEVTVNYGFLVTQNKEGREIEPLWEKSQENLIVTTEDGAIEIESTLNLAEAEIIPEWAGETVVRQEIRYRKPEASQVFLVWGVDGWQTTPEETRPAGTTIKNELMNTPMTREGDTFTAEVQVISGMKIDYGFLITKNSDGAEIKPAWEGSKKYTIIATEDGSVDVKSTLTLPQAPLVTQQIRYQLPEAGEVFLVWKLAEPAAVSEEARPPGTKIKESFMYTPMRRDGDTFAVELQVPNQAKMTYLFLTSKNRLGMSIEVWDAGDNPEEGYQVVATEGNLLELGAAPTVAQEVANSDRLVWMGGGGAVVVLAVAIIIARKWIFKSSST